MLKSFTAVMRDLGVSRTGLYSIIENDKNFPKPIRLTTSQKPRLFFDEGDLNQWIGSKKQQAQDSAVVKRGAES